MPTPNQAQTRADKPHTFAPTLPFQCGPVSAFGPGMWKADIRDALNVKLCAVIERDFTPQENVSQKAAFIVTACNSYASDRAEIKALREALADTAKLANELMDRAARIDRKLALAGGGPVPECELGEITRLRSQLLKNISLTDATLSIGGGK